MEAVTFDFWNTLMWEEPGSLREKRLESWRESLAGVELDHVQLAEAHDAAHEEYVRSWTAGRQFRVEDAVPHIVERLDGDVGPDVEQALVDGFSEGGRRAAVYPCEGVHEALETLAAAGVRMGIICDIGLTPSPVVRELLARHGMLAFFSAVSFSDEVGHYKPDPAIFEHTLQNLGSVAPSRAAHVGDRLRTDVAGARAIGMTAVRYCGVYEDESSGAEADIVVAHLAELPSALGVVEASR